MTSGALAIGGPARSSLLSRGERRLERFILQVYRHHGPEGVMERTWSTGNTVLWIAILLGVMLFLYYL